MKNMIESHRTDWFHAARWGVSSHYLAESASFTSPTDLTAEEWNRQVDAFDVEGLANQIAATGAGFFMLTIGQNSGYYCSPNATYDAIVGRVPSHCSRRDLMMELAEALAMRGVSLIAYLPSNAPESDALAKEKFSYEWGYSEPWPGGWRDELRTGQRQAEFQIKWESVIREWSLRWGDKVRGWWFDGCYFADAMYRHPDAPNFQSFAAAARAGNPNSILAFSPGIFDPDAIGPLAVADAEDYTGGETNNPQNFECRGRWVEGENGHREQWHMWSFLGKGWCDGAPRFSDETAIEITRNAVKNEGVVMWDVPIERSGLIPPEYFEQLQAIGRALRAV